MNFFKITNLENEKKLWINLSIIFLTCSYILTIYNLLQLNLNINFIYVIIGLILGCSITFLPLYFLAYKKNGVKYLIFFMIYFFVMLIIGLIQTRFIHFWMSIPGFLFLYMNFRLFRAIKNNQKIIKA